MLWTSPRESLSVWVICPTSSVWAGLDVPGVMRPVLVGDGCGCILADKVARVLAASALGTLGSCVHVGLHASPLGLMLRVRARKMKARRVKIERCMLG